MGGTLVSSATLWQNLTRPSPVVDAVCKMHPIAKTMHPEIMVILLPK